VRNLWLSAALVAVAGCVIQPVAPVAEAPPPPAPAVVAAPPPVATVAYPGVPDFVSLFLPAIPLPPGRLMLSNYSFALADVESIVTPYPDCAVHPGLVPVDFKLALNSTWVIPTPPGMDVCWRRSLPPTAAAPTPVWTEWNRDYTGAGRAIDSRL
jgi:hypothetical protein